MKKIKIKENYFNLKIASINKETFRGTRRNVCTLTLVDTNYSDIKDNFIDGASWEIIDEGENHYDWSDYNLAGSIIDLRDGTFTVKMAEKFSESELLQQNKISLEENLKIVCGIEKQDDIKYTEIREDIEKLYALASIDNDARITMRNLCELWKKGNHKKGEIYRTVYGINTNDQSREQVWECYANYDNSIYPDLTPDDSSWFTFNKPLHGTTPETAMPFVKPNHAEDIYKAGEYMIYTDGSVYKCISQTNFSPEEYGEAWEKVEV